jgi:hypothetical protein
MLVQSAIIKDGVIYTGRRHHNVLQSQPKGFLKNCEQGFVTDEGKFLNRKDASIHAFECSQIDEIIPVLCSEDLW